MRSCTVCFFACLAWLGLAWNDFNLVGFLCASFDVKLGFFNFRLVSEKLNFCEYETYHCRSILI